MEQANAYPWWTNKREKEKEKKRKLHGEWMICSIYTTSQSTYSRTELIQFISIHKPFKDWI